VGAAHQRYALVVGARVFVVAVQLRSRDAHSRDAGVLLGAFVVVVARVGVEPRLATGERMAGIIGANVVVVAIQR